MILLVPIGTGALACLVFVIISKARLQPPQLHRSWLILVAFLSQWLVFYLPGGGIHLPDDLAAVILVGSMTALLLFVASNHKLFAILLLGLGLVLNLIVITLNGGGMPISPETLANLLPGLDPSILELGARLGAGKDIVLTKADTILWELSDRFVLPAWMPFRVAFSLGDVFIACGGFLLPWAGVASRKVEKR